MSSMNPWMDYYEARYHGCGDPLRRYARALGVAFIIFGAVAHGRMDFFWAGVVLTACSGLL